MSDNPKTAGRSAWSGLEITASAILHAARDDRGVPAPRRQRVAIGRTQREALASTLPLHRDRHLRERIGRSGARIDQVHARLRVERVDLGLRQRGSVDLAVEVEEDRRGHPEAIEARQRHAHLGGLLFVEPHVLEGAHCDATGAVEVQVVGPRDRAERHRVERAAVARVESHMDAVRHGYDGRSDPRIAHREDLAVTCRARRE